MKRNLQFFDYHPMTRIALQLVLDGLPFTLLIGFGVCVYNVFSYPLELEWLMHVGNFGFLIGTLPLFIMGIKLRDDAEDEFACYPWCEWASRTLRILSVLAVSIAVLGDILIVSALISL